MNCRGVVISRVFQQLYFPIKLEPSGSKVLRIEIPNFCHDHHPFRKPFHPKRLLEQWLMPFFADLIDMVDIIKEEETEDKEFEEEVEKLSAEEKEMLEQKLAEEKKEVMERCQKEALEKQKEREATMGELLRSKGFLWLATSNDIKGAWQQAGNVLRIKGESQWMCIQPDLWEGSPLEPIVRKDMLKETGEEWEYKDRRQEIVFIGHGMKREAIQKILDQCLLTDEEMALGPEKWKETMEEFDTIELELEEDEEEECPDEECEDEACDKQEDAKETVMKRKNTLDDQEGAKRVKA